MEERKLPVGVQSFERLRTNDYLYVDKTEYIWNLINRGKSYRLNRPRGFGKSLLLSTIKAYFEGKKDLFKGLAIEKHENEKGEDAWQKYPVICFSLSDGSYNSENYLHEVLEKILEDYAKQYQVNLTGETMPVKFRSLIREIYEKTGKHVVVLVDEYDKPMLEPMEVNPELEEKNRDLYKSFFTVLKDNDAYLKFVLFAGVSNPEKPSVFSDLNQLNDISHHYRCTCICGVTEEELKNNFGPEIREMAAANNQTDEECLEKLKQMYGGYHFSKKLENLYNPYSLIYALQQKKFERYWFNLEEPVFLINALKRSGLNAEQMEEDVRIGEYDLKCSRTDNVSLANLLYQFGYLTISGYRKRMNPGNGIYALNFPNDEVRTGLQDMLAPYASGKKDTDDGCLYETVVRDKEGY